MNTKPLPRVVCSIDGSTLPVQDYSFTSVVNGGYHEFRGQSPVRNLLRLGADQEAPLTVYHEETGDILWDGRFVADPEIMEGVGFISATGPKAELEKSHARMTFQKRGEDGWTDKTSGPHSYVSHPNKMSMAINPGGILFGFEPGETITNGENMGVVFWAPGQQGVAGLWRCAFSYLSSFVDSDWKFECYNMTGPSGAGSLIGQASISAMSGPVDFTSFVGLDQTVLLLTYRGGAPKVMGADYVLVRDLRVNSIAAGDTFYAHQVLQDLGARVGFNTSLVEAIGLNILPLDWTSGSWAGLADYIVSLLDWRWLVSTIATPGEGLVQYLEAGPWEREWTLFKGSRARPNLKPQQRRNEAVVTYKDVGGSERQVRVRAGPDPLAKWGVVRTIEETLADVQADSTLASVVATTYAQRYSQKRWVGDIDAADARDDSGRGDARLVKPGDIGRLADWGPSEETFHRIHGVEQTQTTVRYSIESPISAVPFIEGAALERARRPSEAELPELEEILVEAAGEPAPYADRNAWIAAQYVSRDTGLPDKRWAPGTIHTKPGNKKHRRNF